MSHLVSEISFLLSYDEMLSMTKPGLAMIQHDHLGVVRFILFFSE